MYKKKMANGLVVYLYNVILFEHSDTSLINPLTVFSTTAVFTYHSHTHNPVDALGVTQGSELFPKTL